jgi:hypothetical protein
MIAGRFERTNYARVREAIVTKYGPPTSTSTKSYENKMGATFQGEVAIWEQPRSAIGLTEIFADNIELSNLTIFDPSTQAALIHAAQSKANSDF